MTEEIKKIFIFKGEERMKWGVVWLILFLGFWVMVAGADDRRKK